MSCKAVSALAHRDDVPVALPHGLRAMGRSPCCRESGRRAPLPSLGRTGAFATAELQLIAEVVLILDESMSFEYVQVGGKNRLD